jgi:methionyl-tRNA formyltransferase
VRLAYLGTPDVAVPPLRALAGAGHDVAVVVTRPDRRRGRGGAISPSPVKAEATRLGIPVAHDLDAVVGARVELGVVVAYGRIIPVRVLEEVPMVNLHFSLLPRWRGAAPVERSILAGDQTTGVCVMAVEAGLDTGPVYATAEVPIGPDEALGELRARLVDAGTRLLTDLLDGPLPEPRPQEGEPTYADKIAPEELELRWDRPADELHRVVRLGRAWTSWRGRRLRILRAAVVGAPDGAAAGALDGDVAMAGALDGDVAMAGALDGDVVIAGSGALRLLEVQPEGKAPMAAATWLRGARPAPGERLGNP